MSSMTSNNVWEFYNVSSYSVIENLNLISAICGGELNITDDTEHRLESPNYPLDYLASKECIWKITVPTDYQVI